MKASRVDTEKGRGTSSFCLAMGILDEYQHWKQVCMRAATERPKAERANGTHEAATNLDKSKRGQHMDETAGMLCACRLTSRHKGSMGFLSI